MRAMVNNAAQIISESMLWRAVTRISVPIILAILITGIPTHLLWVSWVNQEVALGKQTALNAREAADDMKSRVRDNTATIGNLRVDVAATRSDVAALLSIVRGIEARLNAAPREMTR